MNLEFREIDPQNYAEAWNFNLLHEFSFRDSFDAHVADSDEKRKTKTKTLIERLLSKDQKYFCLAVFDGSEMIASIFQDSYEIDQQFACHIHGLWVHPDYRKRGIAKDLKARGEAWAKKMGCKFMDTNVRVGNEPMKSLNESLGYEVARLNYRKNL